MAGKNNRKRTRRLIPETWQPMSVCWRSATRDRYIRVDLADGTEPDRRVELELTLEEAHRMAHRLLTLVESAEAANARDQIRDRADRTRVEVLAAGLAL